MQIVAVNSWINVRHVTTLGIHAEGFLNTLRPIGHLQPNIYLHVEGVDKVGHRTGSIRGAGQAKWSTPCLVGALWEADAGGWGQ